MLQDRSNCSLYNCMARRRRKRYYGYQFGKKHRKFPILPHRKRKLFGASSSFSLRPQDPPIYNQGQLGSCSAHASAGICQFVMKKLKKGDFVPARLAIYYWTREMEGTVNQDAGGDMGDAMAVTKKKGLPHEYLWPYNIQKFKTKPPKNVEDDAKKLKVQVILSVQQDLTHMKQCLLEGYPFVFGFQVYSNFDDVTNTGYMPMPTGQPVDGHAVVAIGYDDTVQCPGASPGSMLIRNSWGTTMASGGGPFHGYFWMPYDFILNPNYAQEFLTIRGMKKSKGKMCTFKLIPKYPPGCWH